MTRDPLAGPFMTSTRITDSSKMPGYAIPPAPEGAATSLATQLRKAAFGR